MKPHHRASPGQRVVILFDTCPKGVWPLTRLLRSVGWLQASVEAKGAGTEPLLHPDPGLGFLRSMCHVQSYSMWLLPEMQSPPVELFLVKMTPEASCLAETFPLAHVCLEVWFFKGI